jgi:acyl carrier protein
MSKEILKIVNEIFIDVFDDNSLNIKEDTNADDIEDWDSLANINLVVAMEKEFNIKFVITEIEALENVGDMIDLIKIKKSKS